jgi:hypothetical protein
MSYLPNTFSTRYTGIQVPALGTAGNDLLRINEVDPMFNLLNDGSALLYRMMTMYRKDAPSTQMQYWFFEDDQYAVKTTVNGQVAADGTSIVLDDAIAVKGSVLFFPATDDYALVTAVSGATCTAERNYMGATGAIIADGAEVVLIGATLAEGGNANAGISQLPTKVDNYISLFSQSVSATDVQEVTNMLNGVGQLNGEFSKMTLHVMRQADFALRHSKGLLDTGLASATDTSKPAYYTKGFEQYVTTNAALPSEGMTWYDFNEQFNDAFLPTNSSPSKTLICSQSAFSKINKVAWDRWTANPAFESTLGATIGQIALDGGGLLDVVLDKYGFTSSGKQAYLMDLPYIGVKPLQNFEMNWRDITLPTDHEMKHEIFGSTSLYVKLPSLHRTVTFDA